MRLTAGSSSFQRPGTPKAGSLNQCVSESTAVALSGGRAEELVCRAPEKEPKVTVIHLGGSVKAAHCMILADLIPIQLHVLELVLVRLRGLCSALRAVSAQCGLGAPQGE